MNRAFLAGIIVVASIASTTCHRPPAGTSSACRSAAALIYIKIIDLRALVANAAYQYTSNWPIPRQKTFREFVQNEIRWTALENSIAEVLVKNFTLAEIRALAEFQGSSEGRSIFRKLPAYQAEVVPVIQAEIQRVLSIADLARSQLRWDAPIQEMTAGPADETLYAEFSFRNEGPRSIALLSITTSCGCTTAELKKTVFQPGERGAIRILFVKGNRVGLQDERIVVTTDEPENPFLTLRLRVTIPEALKITPRVLLWESGQTETMKTVTMEIPIGQDIEIIGLDSVSEGFLVKTVPDKSRGIVVATIMPYTAVPPSIGKAVFLAAVGGGRVIRIPVYLRILPPGNPVKTENALGWDDMLWIDTQSAAAYGQSHIPGALPLTEEAWDVQFQSILARWTPGKRIVVYCQPPDQAVQIVQRLKAYGLENLYIIAPGD